MYLLRFLQGTMSEVFRNIEAESVVSQISPPSITFLQFYFLREISVDNHQATKQGIIIGLWYFHYFSRLRLLRRKEIFVNRLQDRLDSLHYDHRVAVFLTLMNTAVTNGLRNILLNWGVMFFSSYHSPIWKILGPLSTITFKLWGFIQVVDTFWSDQSQL